MHRRRKLRVTHEREAHLPESNLISVPLFPGFFFCYPILLSSLSPVHKRPPPKKREKRSFLWQFWWEPLHVPVQCLRLSHAKKSYNKNYCICITSGDLS